MGCLLQQQREGCEGTAGHVNRRTCRWQPPSTDTEAGQLGRSACGQMGGGGGAVPPITGNIGGIAWAVAARVRMCADCGWCDMVWVQARWGT